MTEVQSIGSAVDVCNDLDTLRYVVGRKYAVFLREVEEAQEQWQRLKSLEGEREDAASALLAKPGNVLDALRDLDRVAGVCAEQVTLAVQGGDK
jgi:hypothetical protein